MRSQLRLVYRQAELLPAAACRGRWARIDDGDEAVAVFKRRPRAPCHQLAIQGSDEFLDLRLHLAHLLAHVEDDLHASQIYAEIAREVQNYLQPLEIVLRVEARVAVAAGGLE